MSDDERFSADWLALREPVDHRSRHPGLMSRLATAWHAHGWSRILDLAGGTGSNLRYLSDRLPTPQHWTVVERDPLLIARAGTGPDTADRSVRCLTGDLRTVGMREVARADVVTASALLDLVSADVIERLVERCGAGTRGLLFTLTYDGTIDWQADSAEPDDAFVRDLVNGHQRRDKGLGPALGPTATDFTEALLSHAGYRTWRRPSPWQLGPRDARLVLALVEGWEQAAVAQASDASVMPSIQEDHVRRVRAWATSKRRLVDTGTLDVHVGHLDLLALPEGAA